MNRHISGKKIKTGSAFALLITLATVLGASWGTVASWGT